MKQTHHALPTLRGHARTLPLLESTQECAEVLPHLADADCLQ